MLTSSLSKSFIFQSPSQKFSILRFPKLVCDVHISTTDPFLLSKLKRCKTLKSASLALTRRQTHLVTGILAHNQGKSLETYRGKKKFFPSRLISKFSNLSAFEISLSLTQDIKFLSYLPKLSLLKLRSAAAKSSAQNTSLFKDFFSRKISKLRQLQKVTLSGELDSKLMQAFKVLDSSLLPNLKTIVVDQLIDNSEGKILYKPLKIYSKITSLSLKSCYNCTFLHHFLNHTREFVALDKLAITCENVRANSWASLRNIQYLPSLKHFSFLVYGASQVPKDFMVSFFADFCLPKQVETIELSLGFVAWDNLLPVEDNWSENMFEEDPLFQEFFSKWEHLACLQDLSVRFEVSQLSNRNVLSYDFVSSILKRTKSLRAVSLAFETHYLEDEEDWTTTQYKDQQIFQVPYLFKSMAHLTDTLKAVSVESPLISLGSFDLRDKFRLNEFKLNGLVLDTLDFDTVKYVMNKDRSQKAHVIMQDLWIEDEDTHYCFLNKLRVLPNFFTGTISAKCPSNNRRDFLLNLEQFLKTRHVSKNVCLDYKFEFLGTVNLRSLELAILESRSFEQLQVKGLDKVFTYSRPDETTCIRALVGGQGQDNSFNDFSLENIFESGEQGEVETDEDLSFFLPHGRNNNDEDDDDDDDDEDDDDENEDENANDNDNDDDEIAVSNENENNEIEIDDEDTDKNGNQNMDNSPQFGNDEDPIEVEEEEEEYNDQIDFE